MLIKYFLYVQLIVWVVVIVVVRSKTLYIDKNNPSCDNSITRDLNSLQQPWCGLQAIKGYGNPKGIIGGDKILIKEGVYENSNQILQFDGDSKGVIIENYEDDEVILNLSSRKENGWSVDGILHKITGVSTGKVQLIKREGYGIYGGKDPDVITKNELINTPSLLQGYDLYYHEGNEIWVKLINGNDVPSRDIYFVGEGNRIDLFSDYIEIIGLTIQYGYDGIKDVGSSSNCKIINCTIRYISNQGILSNSDNHVIKGNYIEKCGKPFKNTGTHVVNNLDHAMYLTGSNYNVSDNFMKDCHGCCLHPYPTPSNHRIFNNVVYDGFCCTGSNHLVYDNFIEKYLFIWGSGSIVRNNIVYSDENSAYYNRYNTQFDQVFENNIVRTVGGRWCMHTYRLDFSSTTSLENNLYLDCSNFGVGYNGATINSFSDFDSYQAFMESTYSLERNSIIYDSDTTFIDKQEYNQFRINYKSPHIDF